MKNPRLEQLIELIQQFEERNNLSIALTLYSDGSFYCKEFWDNEKLGEGSKRSLIRFLKHTNYELDPVDGRCFSPVRRIKQTRKQK